MLAITASAIDAADHLFGKGRSTLIRHHNDTGMEVLSKLEEKTADFEYFSFDIFDTIITRICHFPTDLFVFIETMEQSVLKGYTFADRRVRAESIARDRAFHRGEHEITLDQIYDEIKADLPLPPESIDRLKKAEIKLEIDLAEITSQGAALLAMLGRHNGRFILTSDMYLPRSVIEAMLAKCGVSGHEILLLSNEKGKTKHEGSLYDDVIDHFDCSPEKILHIGDNRYSDFTRAQQSGLAAFHLPAARDAFNNGDIWATTALFRGGGALKNIFNAQFINDWPAFDNFQNGSAENYKDYWEAFGVTVVAPMMLSLVFWLKDRATELGVSKIGFLARDGFFAKRCFDLVFTKTEIETDYLAASRRMLTVPNAVLSPTELSNYYRSLIKPGLTGASILSRIPGADALTHRMKGLGLPPDKILEKDDMRLFYQILGENSGILTHALRHEAEAVREYLESKIPANAPYGIFDLGWRGSLQKSIDKILGVGSRDVVGFYFGTNGDALSTMRYKPGNHHSYAMHNGMPEHERNSCQSHTDVIEFIFSASHGSVTGIKKNDNGYEWIMAEPSEAEKKSQDTAAIFQRSALEAIESVLQTVPFDTLYQLHSARESRRDFFDFLGDPSAYDSRCFSEVKIFSSIGDGVGIDLVGDYPLWHLHRAARDSLWKAAFYAGMSKKARRMYRYTATIRRLVHAFRDNKRKVFGR